MQDPPNDTITLFYRSVPRCQPQRFVVSLIASQHGADFNIGLLSLSLVSDTVSFCAG